jgi:superfamily II DNA helicase RecQ
LAAWMQIFMLTAMLPLSEEDELFGRTRLNREHLKMFHARTTRTNVAYQVVRKAKALKEEIAEAIASKAVRRKLTQFRSGKAVVYGLPVAKDKKLAEPLECNACYHDPVDKASMLAHFYRAY